MRDFANIVEENGFAVKYYILFWDQSPTPLQSELTAGQSSDADQCSKAKRVNHFKTEVASLYLRTYTVLANYGRKIF